MKCEAAAMAFGAYDDTNTPPCNEEASVETEGYSLCAGCREALDRLRDLGMFREPA